VGVSVTVGSEVGYAVGAVGDTVGYSVGTEGDTVGYSVGTEGYADMVVGSQVLLTGVMGDSVGPYSPPGSHWTIEKVDAVTRTESRVEFGRASFMISPV